MTRECRTASAATNVLVMLLERQNGYFIRYYEHNLAEFEWAVSH